METSDRIFYRIKWDTKIDHKKCQIGYLDKKKLKTINYTEWLPIREGGDIPWHRIYKFYYCGEILWDREKRIYNQELFNTNAATTGGLITKTEIRLFSLNCCYEITDTSKQDQQIICILENDADIVALQEVNSVMMDRLTTNHQLKEKYSIISGHAKTKTLYNLVFLSKIPPAEVHQISFTSNTEKYYLQLIYLIDFGSGPETLSICNVHLTSNLQIKASSKRAAQMKQIMDDISGSTSSIIMGDFNESENFDGIYGYDLGEKTGICTFDPETNGLAKSKSGRSSRYDRIIIRGNITAKYFKVLTKQHISDHYPILAELTLALTQSPAPLCADTSEVGVGVGTVLAIMIEPEYWLSINKYRKRYDLGHYRTWGPHVTLFQKFILPDKWYIVKELISNILKTNQSDDIIFDRVELFKHISNYSVVLTSTNSSKFTEIRDLIARTCGIDYDSESIPHITLGSFSDQHKAQAVKKEIEAAMPMLSVPVKLDYISFMKKIAGDQFRVYDYVTVIDKPDDPVKLIRDLASAVQSSVDLKIVGSAAYGINDSDYDIAINGANNPEKFLQQLESFAKMTPHVEYAELIKSKIPILNLILRSDTEINVTCNTKTAIDMVDYVKTKLGLDLKDFVQKYKAIKKWAQIRRVYGSKYGFVNGIGLLLMVLNIYDNSSSAVEFVHKFFVFYSNYDWSKAINIANRKYEAKTKSDLVVMIIYPLESRNVLRTVSKNTWKLFVNELLDASTNHKLVFMERKTKKWNLKVTITAENIYDLHQRRRLMDSELWRIYGKVATIVPQTRWFVDKTALTAKICFDLTGVSDNEIIYEFFRPYGVVMEFR